MKDVRQLSREQLKDLQQEIVLILSGISDDEIQSELQVAPIDLPIHGKKNPDTGTLWIQYPFAIGLRKQAGWTTVEVTAAAQQELIQIFSKSLMIDEQAGRTQPTKTTLQ